MEGRDSGGEGGVHSPPLLVSSAASAQSPLRLAVLTFEDRAGFQGKWDRQRCPSTVQASTIPVEGGTGSHR